MAEAWLTRDTLVSNSGIAKGMFGRTQALQNACFALPSSSQKIKIL